MIDSFHSSDSFSFFQMEVISLWISKQIVLPPALISSADIWSIPARKNTNDNIIWRALHAGKLRQEWRHTLIIQCFVDRASSYIRITWINKMHYFLLIYFNSKPLHVSSRLAAHHQENQLCVSNSWYMSCVMLTGCWQDPIKLYIFRAGLLLIIRRINSV